MTRVLVAILFLSQLTMAQTGDVTPVRTSLVGGDLRIRVQSGALRFATAILTSRGTVVPGVSVPGIEISDARGTGEGWSVTLQARDLVGTRQSIDSSRLSFRAAGGQLLAVQGQAVGVGGPRETGISRTLAGPVTVLRVLPGYGMGTYIWTPQPSNFQLKVPAECLAGQYRGQMLVTVVSGP